jgi:hypothetical protein
MVSMSHPDDVARLREIKRLLDRIQRLPRIAAMPINAPLNGPLPEPPLERAIAAGPANGLDDGPFDLRPSLVRGGPIGPPHPTAELDVRPPERKGEADAALALDVQLDPLPASFDARNREEKDDGRSDYWTSDDGSEPRALVLARPPAAGGLGISPWVFIVATAVNTVVAAVLAIVITLGVARREAGPVEAEKVAASAKPAPEVQPEPMPRPVELLPVGSAKQPLRLEALKPARLPFEVRPEEAMQDSYIMLLTGLPPNATLSGASRMGADSWHLPPGALQRLELVVPEWSATVYEVGVELRRTNGAVAARSKLWLAVPPPPTPTGASLDEAALKELVRSGDKLLSRGDVAAARAVYERAAAMGSAQAALAMGTTFDPRQLWALGVFGMVGNKERARAWYRRAEELGHPDAKARIVALQ